MAGEAQRRTTEWPLALTLLVAATGLVVLTFYNWRNGVLTFAAAPALAALLRATLPERTAGLLHVRGRTFDILFLLATATAIATLALIVPN
ncbi:DUF3017 domain-containing protein [Kribbella sandramycini]|uniref:DUF3017 domain-containing protein n=1 Tax=Kribbella sandramycini TaxID=60450 RepID=A0A7Y4L563_9ACTN|nr:DUF3017 domain-containing protein [Kribbella sandramycini]MBB6566836.1 hypothetical protein [Kribbella sandramycini]NOL44558.1 DUF3017 domain-containing protein [Kribbella sandramycini]